MINLMVQIVRYLHGRDFRLMTQFCQMSGYKIGTMGNPLMDSEDIWMTELIG